jgi:hypothetical protein
LAHGRLYPIQRHPGSDSTPGIRWVIRSPVHTRSASCTLTPDWRAGRHGQPSPDPPGWQAPGPPDAYLGIVFRRLLPRGSHCIESRKEIGLAIDRWCRRSPSVASAPRCGGRRLGRHPPCWQPSSAVPRDQGFSKLETCAKIGITTGVRMGPTPGA